MAKPTVAHRTHRDDPEWQRRELHKRVIVDPTTQCWVFQGFKNRGYGKVQFGLEQYAHRVAYIVFVGPIPQGADILHRCDNPPCINPAHLFPGSHSDNMRDMCAKGRVKRKLTPDDVRAIRSDPRPQYIIGAEYGIHQSQVARIKAGLRWRHLD